MKKTFFSRTIKCFLLCLTFLNLISCSYLNFDISEELSKFQVPDETKYIVPNSIFTTCDFKFLDKNAKELSNVTINIEGCSYMEVDNENVYFLHYPINEKGITKTQLPTASLKYDLKTKKLHQLSIPRDLKDFSISSVSKNYNNDVLAIYENINLEPTENNRTVIYNLTTDEVINSNLSYILDVQKIDNNYYMFGTDEKFEEDKDTDSFDDYSNRSVYKLVIYDSENDLESEIKLGEVDLNARNSSEKADSLSYKLLVLNDDLHIITPKGELLKLNLEDFDKPILNKVKDFDKVKNSDSIIYYDSVKSNGYYSYISYSNTQNLQSKKHIILDSNYNITELNNDFNFNYTNSDVQLYKDRLTIFTSDQNVKSINNSNFYLLEFNLKTQESKTTNLSYLYSDGNEDETFIPSKLIDIEPN